MITVRNPTAAHALTVVTSVAMEVGQIAALIQGTAAGEPVQVRIATAADLDDATIVKGVVDFILDDDLAVDYIKNPATGARSVNTGSDGTQAIPAGAAVAFWYNKPIIGFAEEDVDDTLDITAVREGAKVAALAASGKLVAYNAAAVNTGAENYLGTIYRNEGPEITVLLNAL
jgi:phosphatidate phosphatase APP1